MRALSLVFGFCIGILLASLLPTGWWGTALLFFLSALFFILFRSKGSRAFFLAALFLAASTMGSARVLVAPSVLPSVFRADLGHPISYEGVVTIDPDVRESTNRLTIRVTKEGVETNVLAVTPLYPEVRLGEQVHVRGVLEVPEAFESGEGRMFHYERYLAKDGIFSIIHNASLEVVGPRKGIGMQMRGFFSDLKFAGIDALATALPEPEASLAAGLILGGKQGLGEELLQDFIRSGLVHIVVLSGYNVMIVAEAVLRAFGFLSTRVAATVASVVIGAFVLVAGAGAASVRAGLMAGIALYGRASKRTYDACRALFAAGALMLLWNPLLLAYDPGFQLSFIATLGLIFGAPITEGWLRFIKIKFLREIISATLAAQISVLPLLLYQNGLFSVVALPANILVLPLVPVAMFFSAVALLAGMAVPAVATFIGFPAYVLLTYIVHVVTIASALPLTAIALPAFPFFLVAIAYALLTFWVYRVQKHREVL